MGQLDADCIAIAVANVPAQAVLRHRVVHNGTVKLHHMMDGVGIISAPIIDVIAGARAGVRRLMNDKIARIEPSMTTAHIAVDTLVGFRAARGGKGRHKGDSNGKDAMKRQLTLSLAHSLHPLSCGLHRPPAQLRHRSLR